MREEEENTRAKLGCEKREKLRQNEIIHLRKGVTFEHRIIFFSYVCRKVHLNVCSEIRNLNFNDNLK